MSVYSHILLATDLSEITEKTSEKALEIAKLFKAKVSLVHVVEPIAAYAYVYAGAGELEANLVKQAKQDIAKLAEKLEIPAEDQYVKEGPTKIVILELAKEIGADLIVVGSHGRHGLARLLGSTANAVVHSSDVDVLTVRFED